MSLFAVRRAEVFVVYLLDCRAFVRFAQIGRFIEVIKDLCAELTEVNVIAYHCGLIRLTAAVYASARTCHDLDEVYLDFAGLDHVEELLCVCRAACYCNANYRAVKIVLNKNKK